MSDFNLSLSSFCPFSKEFREAEQLFHEDLAQSTCRWKQIVVGIFSAIGGIFFIVGAFPVFTWTVKWLKSETSSETQKTQGVATNQNLTGNPNIQTPVKAKSVLLKNVTILDDNFGLDEKKVIKNFDLEEERLIRVVPQEITWKREVEKVDDSLSCVSLKHRDGKIDIPKNLLILQSETYESILKHQVDQTLDLHEELDFETDLEESDGSVTSKKTNHSLDVINYLLKGKININPENVMILLDFAHKFKIDHLRKGCFEALETFQVELDDAFIGALINIAQEPSLTENVIKILCGKHYFFSKSDWEKYYGDVGEVPLLPKDILTTLTADCPIFEGKKVCETHMLILLPEKLNGKDLSYLSMCHEHVLKQTKGGSGGHNFSDIYDSHYMKEDKDSLPPSRWMLITKTGILNRWFNASVSYTKLIEKFPGYSRPLRRDFYACLQMHYASSGKSFFNRATEFKTTCYISDDLENNEIYDNLPHCGDFAFNGFHPALILARPL